MKYRKEKSGLHFFDRKTGVHFLFDEIKFKNNEIDKAPRTVSLAITNDCNYLCPYCYNLKTKDMLEIGYLKSLVLELDKLGCLELTIGGGEPLLHPNILEFCNWTWKNTSLGINITTNGFFLDKILVDNLKACVSSIRVSLNSISDEKNNSKVMKNLIYARKNINIGINTIFFPDKKEKLVEVIEYSLQQKIENILIIPIHNSGSFLLTPQDWENLEIIIENYKKKINLYVTSEASKFMKIDFLDTENEFENLFVSISAKKEVKRQSFDETGYKLNNVEDIYKIFKKIEEE